MSQDHKAPSYRNTKHRLIARQLKQQVLDGAFGDRLPTLIDLAETWQVAPPTMRKAVHSLKREGIVHVVRGQGIFPTRLKRARAHVLGAVLPGTGPSHICARLIQSLARYAPLRGEAIALGDETLGAADRELAVVRGLVEKQKVDGVVIWPGVPADRGPAPAVAYLVEENIPFVVVPEPDPAVYRDCCTVSISSGHATADLMTHLIAGGHREIGFVVDTATSATPYAAERRRQYERSLRAAGFTVREPIMLPHFPDDVPKELDDRAWTALRACSAAVCVNDHVAFELLHHCLRAGVRVPADLAVAGYDNVLLAEVMRLTTVEHHLEQVAAQAIDLLLDELAGQGGEPVQRRVEAELVIRESTQPESNGHAVNDNVEEMK